VERSADASVASQNICVPPWFAVAWRDAVITEAFSASSWRTNSAPMPEVPPKEYIRLKIKDGTAVIKVSDILAISTIDFEKQKVNVKGGNKKVYLETSSPILITDISLEEVFKQLNSPNHFILSDSCIVQRKAVIGHTRTKAFIRLNINPALYEENRGGCEFIISDPKREAFFQFLEQSYLHEL
jgi:hypothetical protein